MLYLAKQLKTDLDNLLQGMAQNGYQFLMEWLFMLYLAKQLKTDLDGTHYGYQFLLSTSMTKHLKTSSPFASLCPLSFSHETSHYLSGPSTSSVQKILPSINTISIDLFMPLCNEEESRTWTSIFTWKKTWKSNYLLWFSVVGPLSFFIWRE